MQTPVIVLIYPLLFALALSIGINIKFLLDKKPPQTSPRTNKWKYYTTNTIKPNTHKNNRKKPNTNCHTTTPRTGTTPDHDITITYSETSRRTIGNNMTKVIVSIHLQYGSGDSVTINYNKFILSIQAPRNEIIQQKAAEAHPLKADSVTVNNGNRNADFQLTDRFATTYTTSTGLYHFTNYYLVVLP